MQYVVVRLPKSHRAYKKIVYFEGSRNVLLIAHKVGGSYLRDSFHAAAIPAENLERAKQNGATIPRGSYTYSTPYFPDKEVDRKNRALAAELGFVGARIQTNPGVRHMASKKRQHAMRKARASAASGDLTAAQAALKTANQILKVTAQEALMVWRRMPKRRRSNPPAMIVAPMRRALAEMQTTRITRRGHDAHRKAQDATTRIIRKANPRKTRSLRRRAGVRRHSK